MERARSRRRLASRASPSRLAVQAHSVPHLLVVVAIWTAEQRLALADGKKAAADQAVIKQSVSALLKRRSEIDEYVRADDEMEVVEGSVGDQVVPGPGDAALQIAVEPRGPSADRVVIGEGAATAGLLIRLLEPPHAVDRIGPESRNRQHVLVQVGRIKGASAEHPFFVQQDRKRIDLLAGGASRDPNPAGR